MYSPSFLSLFLPQRNHAGLIADSLPIPSAASLLPTVNAACAAAAAALSRVPPAVPRCQAAEDWQRPDTGAGGGGGREKHIVVVGGGGHALQRQCRGNMMQMQHNAVVERVEAQRGAMGGGCIADETVQGRPREGCFSESHWIERWWCVCVC